ncbi:MAG: ATP-binding cassette domain-containing protein [Acidimicrobiales bacterium]
MSPSDVASVRRLVQIHRTTSAGGTEVQALRGVDATFSRAAMTALVGPSGSGKSSLLRILALMDRPSAGLVEIDGIDVLAASPLQLRVLRREVLGIVRQRPTHNLIGHLDVVEHLQQAGSQRGLDRRSSRAETAAALDAVGLGDRRSARPKELSGGEQQRLAVAMAMIGAPPMVVADEPTAELDADNAARVVALLHEASRRGAGVVVATHDPAVVAAADRVLTLHHGTLTSESGAAAGTTHAVIDEAGRVQLPPELLDRFPTRRATMTVEDDAVVLRPEGSA